MKQLLLILLFSLCVASGQVSNSKHNLSTGGIGEIKASDTDLICIFCHTSHSGDASAPLWNRESGAVNYTTYTSSTLFSNPGQPSGTSKLCLSCHDGTVALGQVISRVEPFNMVNTSNGRIPSSFRSNLDSNLGDDHPVSFLPDLAISSSSEYIHPTLPVHFENDGMMQCTSCHDPHDNGIEPFLLQSTANAQLCKNCHNKTGYDGQTTHDTSPAIWSGSPELGPWPTSPYNSVALNSCMNCHRPHAAGHNERLLSKANDEDVCLNCHNGNLGPNIGNDLNRYSAHSVSQYSGHDPNENLETATTHVECVDCHNPHQLDGSPATAPWINGTLKGVSGRTTTGVTLDTATQEFEVCIKCHGLSQYFIPSPVLRVFDTSNIGDAFNPSNASYHPVAAVGKSARVPSLTNGYSIASRMYCIDCHNSSNASNAGGSGPRGPHGSDEPYLLERRYDIGGFISYGSTKYAMCFKCHDETRILNRQQSGFQYHRLHVMGENSPCSVCHDPHGVATNVALINFDTSVVTPDQNGRLEFFIQGDRGYCYLSCHGENHNPESYGRQ